MLVFLLIAPIISLLIFISAIYVKNKKNHVKINFKNVDKELVFITFLMILSCIINSFLKDKLIIGKFTQLNFWIDLFNWIPFFISFYLVKPFVTEKVNRKNFLLAIFTISAPIMIIIGWLQILDINEGSLNLFGGLIRWFPYAADTHNMGDAINPIFKSSNYSATGLLICFGASLSFVFDKSKTISERISLITLLVGIFTSILLTRSSIAILCISLLIPIFLGIHRYKYMFSILSFIGIFIIFISLIKNDLFFREFNIVNIFASLEVRFSIWKETLNYILQKPLFGWGAGAFPLLYGNKDGYTIHHAHNLFLELAFNYGIPTSLMMMNFILKIPINTYKKVFYKKKNRILNSKLSLIDRTWVTLIFLLIIVQFFDTQIYDGRINLILWLLISGCHQICHEKNKSLLPQ